jgi:hypothetical protein
MEGAITREVLTYRSLRDIKPTVEKEAYLEGERCRDEMMFAHLCCAAVVDVWLDNAIACRPLTIKR